MQFLIEVAEPVLHGPLTLFPAFSESRQAPGYLCGPDAEPLGVIVIREVEDGARVPDLVVENHADLPILLVEGETLLGAKQNRTLNVSVLCPPGVATTIPVSCVEAGRWGRSRAGARSHHHAPSRLRGHKTESVVKAIGRGFGPVSDQGRVWADVDEYATRRRVESSTAALEDVYDDVEGETSELVRELRPLEGQRGVIAAVGGQVVSLDLFDKPASLASYWDGLLAGYVLEATHQSPVPAASEDARSFAKSVSNAPIQGSSAPGLGHQVRLAGPGVVGLGLEWEDALVHLAAFTHERGQLASRPIHRGHRR